MNQIDLRGRGAVVTGGARGIGYACAERLAASGAKVSLWDMDGAALAEAAKKLDGAHTITVDAKTHAVWTCYTDAHDSYLLKLTP